MLITYSVNVPMLRHDVTTSWLGQLRPYAYNMQCQCTILCQKRIERIKGLHRHARPWTNRRGEMLTNRRLVH